MDDTWKDETDYLLILSQFLTMLRTAADNNKIAKSIIEDTSGETQDILHHLELADNNNADYILLAEALSGVRKRRRFAKDSQLITDMILEWANAHQKEIRELERLLGLMRREMNVMQNRSWMDRSGIIKKTLPD